MKKAKGIHVNGKPHTLTKPFQEKDNRSVEKTSKSQRIDQTVHHSKKDALFVWITVGVGIENSKVSTRHALEAVSFHEVGCVSSVTICSRIEGEGAQKSSRGHRLRR